MDTPDDLSGLNEQLGELLAKLKSAIGENEYRLGSIDPGQQQAARNLLEYLALRSQDIRSLQDRLHVNGLSSLASSESHIRRQIEAILERLGRQFLPGEISSCNYAFGRRSIHERARQLFGEKTDAAIPSIMVTFDTAFAGNDPLVKNLLLHGMNIARINCAHDDEATWRKMIGSIRLASMETGLHCKLYMDLAGPKLRTVILGKGRKEGKVTIAEGDHIILAESNIDIPKKTIAIGCTLPGIVRHLKKGDRILFDDGAMEGVIEEPGPDKAGLRITRISTEKHRLKNEKGMNFPDSGLGPIALTDYDRQCLPFIAEHADMVGYSFVETEAGLAMLQEALPPGKDGRPYIVLKIERAAAVQNLPGLLLQGMQRPAFGVMVARGDLAMEIGFERLSEIQEEIVWLAEAAHAPVIWATQVLENLNKTGLATRSEVTDAAHACMAECVMINKGDYILDAMDTLRNILQRSGGHHVKKRYIFRPLSIAKNFMTPHP